MGLLTRPPRPEPGTRPGGSMLDVSMLAPVTALILGATAAAVLVDGARESGDLSAYDPAASTAVIAARSTGFTWAAQALTFAGSTLALVPLTALLLAILALRGRWRAMAAVAMGMSLSLGLTIVLKTTVGRLRPAATDVLGTVDTGYAFPSGHTLNATVFYGLLACLLIHGTRHRGARVGIAVGWLVLALGVGVSRIYLGYHWMTDVMAGWSIGIAVLGSVLLASMLVRRGRAGPS